MFLQTTSMKKLFGLLVEMIVGRTMPEVIGQQRFDFVEPYVRRAISGGENRSRLKVHLRYPRARYITLKRIFYLTLMNKIASLGSLLLVSILPIESVPKRPSRNGPRFLEALLDSSHEGILVVDSEGKKLLQNSRMSAVWNIPQEIADDLDDARQVSFVADRTMRPSRVCR